MAYSRCARERGRRTDSPREEDALNDERARAQELVIDEAVADALEAFQHLLTPGDRDLAKQIASDILATHPVTADLLDIIVPAATLEHSDKLAKDASDDETAASGGEHE